MTELIVNPDKESRANDIPLLSENYHKAHRLYCLVSAVLLAWELIGFEIRELSVGGLKFTLETPWAVPYVLVALVVYSAAKMHIEWSQCHTERRKQRYARLDNRNAHIIGGISLFIFIYQLISGEQIADVRTIHSIANIIGGMLFIIAVMFVEARHLIRFSLVGLLVSYLVLRLRIDLSSTPVILEALKTLLQYSLMYIVFAMLVKRTRRVLFDTLRIRKKTLED